MFFIPVPPGKLIWDCEALVNSVVMKYSMRKPQGQSSLYAPPPPSASELSGNRLLQIPQEGVKPLVGTVGSRTRACSHCCAPRSFNELMPAELLGPPPHPYSKQRFQDIPWRLSAELPPQPPAQRPCSAPQLRASCSQIIQRVPCRWENTLSLRLRVCRCLPSGLFLLT